MTKPMDYNTDENGFALKTHGYSVDTKSTDKRTQQQSDSADDNPIISTEIDPNSGLCRLLLMQLIFGVTYCGNCPAFKNFLLKKILLVTYDCTVIGSFAYFEWYAFSDDVFTRIFYVTKHKGVMKILFRFAGLSMAIEFFSIKSMLLKNGWKLVKTIKDTGVHNVTKVQSYTIMVYLLLMAVLCGTMLPINFMGIETLTHEKLRFMGFFIVGIFYAMNKLSITSLVLFTAFITKKQIKDWTIKLRIRSIKVQVLCESILSLRNQLEIINDMIGVILLIKVFVNAMFMSACVCVTYLEGIPVNAIICIIGFAVISVSDVISLCYASQIMINSMANLCKQVEQTLIMDSCYGYGGDGGADYYKQLNVILSMRDSIRLKVLSLFDLKTVTILAIVGYVCNYAIILIQTSF